MNRLSYHAQLQPAGHTAWQIAKIAMRQTGRAWFPLAVQIGSLQQRAVVGYLGSDDVVAVMRHELAMANLLQRLGQLQLG